MSLRYIFRLITLKFISLALTNPPSPVLFSSNPTSQSLLYTCTCCSTVLHAFLTLVNTGHFPASNRSFSLTTALNSIWGPVWLLGSTHLRWLLWLLKYLPLRKLICSRGFSCLRPRFLHREGYWDSLRGSRASRFVIVPSRKVPGQLSGSESARLFWWDSCKGSGCSPSARQEQKQ